jgi:hypothetical protein
MRRICVLAAAVVVLFGCTRSPGASQDVSPPAHDGGVVPPPVSPPPPVPDAGPTVQPDEGTPDAGPQDAGPDAHSIGGLGAGAFPLAPLTTYGSAQGLLESPLSASVDESENLWVVTSQAL